MFPDIYSKFTCLLEPRIKELRKDGSEHFEVLVHEEYAAFVALKWSLIIPHVLTIPKKKENT